ncbi:MAG: type II toxin-antitoxin system VapC family toxin [Propionibacteriaceae bacterium]|nr:type II toxin-antitoxin system VapC family toxin [Propionibacteriaceae bacterium]
MVVVDASVLAAFYASDDPRRVTVSHRLAVSDSLFAPAHLDAEVVSTLRGLARRNPTLNAVVPRALAHLAAFPIRRLPLAPLLTRMWDLRDNVTPYDAAYVALAERLGSPLITCDARLTMASGCGCVFELIV